MTNKATTRFTSAQRQAELARQDRRAEAAARRADRQNGIESVAEQNARVYANVGR